MKAVSYLIVGLLCIVTVSSCTKKGTDGDDTQIDPVIVAKSQAFRLYVSDKKFQVSDFYADKPIDYAEDDSTVHEKATELYQYTSKWIRDDLYSFDTTAAKVTIAQDSIKIAGNSDALIIKDFSIVPEKDGVKFKFYDHKYEPLTYTLVDMTDTYFLVYVDWVEGSKVYTKFAIK
jgi:hypothetical protein